MLPQPKPDISFNEKTFQGGKTKIFALLKVEKVSTFELIILLLKLLVQTRKKDLIQISHDSFFMWRDIEFQWSRLH